MQGGCSLRGSWILLGLAWLLSPGCISSIHCYVLPPETIRLRLTPGTFGERAWSIVVEEDPPVTASLDVRGCATIVLPPDRECHFYRLGVPVDPTTWRENARVRIECDGVVVCTLVLDDLDELPLDPDGCRVLVLDS